MNFRRFDRYYPELILGLLLGILTGWGLFGAFLGLLLAYFIRVLRKQSFAEEADQPCSQASKEEKSSHLVNSERLLEEAYTILGVSQEMGNEEIRRIYRSLAASFHPDGMAQLSSGQRKEAEEAFLRIRGAWELIARGRGIHP